MQRICKYSMIAAFFCTTFIVHLDAADAPNPPAPATVIFDMDTLRHVPGEFTDSKKQKVPAGTAELVDGKFGKAVKFSFVQGAAGGFMTARVKPTAEWDAAAGISFWVKGDGSKSLGGIELIDQSDYSQRYAYCFPIDSTEWKKIVVPWRDFTPELSGPLISGKDGYHPSHLGSFSFGKWWYWREYPAESYAIDQVALESRITEVQPLSAVEPGLKRLRAKLEQHKPITIVTMGDSLTDEQHWSNRKTVWHRLLADALNAKYGSAVTIINPAIGGTTLSQNMVLMPRWLAEAPEPDLVAVWFGGNDWGAGVRGPRFAEYLREVADRIRRQTHGHADVLLMTTLPNHANWETMKELEQAVRDVAAEKHTGLADIAGEFRKVATPDAALKQEYWGWDKVHLGGKGHEVTRDVVLRVIAEEK